MATLLPVTHCLILPCAWRMSLLSYIYGRGGGLLLYRKRPRFVLLRAPPTLRRSGCRACTYRFLFFVAVALVYLLFVKVRFTMHPRLCCT